MATVYNNPGILTKVMDMLHGFRTIDRVFNASTSGTTGEITAGMLCSATGSAGSASAVTLIKGFTSGMPYFALNNYFDDDAQAMKYTTMGTGSGTGASITAIPANVAGELVIPLALLSEANTDAYMVGDEVVPSHTIGSTPFAATYTADGMIEEAPAASAFKSGDTMPVVGIVSEVRSDAIVIYPQTGKVLTGTKSA